MRIGIDLGGTKIEIAALGDDGRFLLRERVPTPQGEYAGTIRAIADLVCNAEAMLGRPASVGIAIPGTLSTKSGFVKNANSTWLIGKPLDKDISAALKRPVRMANDANCFALSEAADGAAKDCRVVFGVILGTGVGGGVAVDGHVLNGAHGIAGEWGHNPLPARADELPGPQCYCGKRGCIETWLSGPALERLYEKTPGGLPGLYLDRLARALATVVNLLDPDVIVLGGGLSNIDALYAELPARVESYAFTPEAPPKIVKNIHGDSSGVRGAAWLWQPGEVHSGLPE